jgi:hypothetical protein
MNPMTITLGIDLGSQPATTAACLMRWEPGTATVLDLGLGLDDKALLGLARDADKVGIDAPFGWLCRSTLDERSPRPASLSPDRSCRPP